MIRYRNQVLFCTTIPDFMTNKWYWAANEQMILRGEGTWRPENCFKGSLQEVKNQIDTWLTLAQAKFPYNLCKEDRVA